MSRDNVIQRRGTKRKQRSMTAQENDRLPSCSGDRASRHEMNGLVSKALLDIICFHSLQTWSFILYTSEHFINFLQRSGDQYVVDEVNIDDEEENEFDDILHTPKRRKLKTTTRYIFETLFLEGQDSDITLFALNREWKLHKVRFTTVKQYWRRLVLTWY